MNVSQPVPEWVLTVGGWIDDRAFSLAFIVGLPIVAVWMALAWAFFQYVRAPYRVADKR